MKLSSGQFTDNQIVVEKALYKLLRSVTHHDFFYCQSTAINHTEPLFSCGWYIYFIRKGIIIKLSDQLSHN